jgi:hypothetical protein
MPDEFPTPREEMVAECEDLGWTYQVDPCGPGVAITAKRDQNYTRMFTTLIEDHGWYCSEYQPKDTGDIVHIMPVPYEVLA